VELVETKVRELNHILNELMRNLAVSSSNCLIGIALKIVLNLRVKLIDLLDCFIIKSIRVKHAAHKGFISNILNGVLLVVILVLEESIVSLSVSASHLNSADTSSISHMADHSRVNGIHEISGVSHTVIKEVIAFLFVG
jgi:hypothetical protein